MKAERRLLEGLKLNRLSRGILKNSEAGVSADRYKYIHHIRDLLPRHGSVCYLRFRKDLGMLLYEEIPARSGGRICKGISNMNRDNVGIQAVISQVRLTEIQ